MIIKGDKKVFEIGDALKIHNTVYVFDEILSQQYFPAIGNDVDEYINIEFKTNGKYHHYKNNFDGGEIIPKEKNYINTYGTNCTDIFKKYGYK